MPDPLLSSLCSICYVHPHKYRCPRCFVLTCSLPCIKRHKQWAQCNGIRDPTKYMKRSDLATPKGIDHDYNYLTSIERELDYAEKDALSRGFVLEEEPRRTSKQPAKGETQFRAALERCRVIVTKAPKGMTRSKQNRTICSRKNRTLQWTVEWVHPNGKRTMDKLWETQRISTAYDDHLKYSETSRPRKRPTSDQKHNDPAASAITESSSVPSNDSTAGKQRSSSTTASPGKRKRDEDEANVYHAANQDNSTMVTRLDPITSEVIQHPASIPPSSNPPPATEEPAPSANINFYLHHPSLPSRHPVLVPLPPDARLETSLTNRIVLEFPTIYVLHKRADGHLPEGYVSQEDFFAKAKKDLVEEVAAGEAIGEDGEEGKEGGLEDGEVDEGRLLEVLGKDLKGVVGSLRS